MLGDILSFIGKGFDMFNSDKQTDKKIAAEKELQAQNIANQKEFAQHGIRWKVSDAQAAGLHPLAALGATTSSFSNVVGGNYEPAKSDFGGMGQDIGRAMDAASTQDERRDKMGAAIARTAQMFSLEKMNLENEVLKSDLALKRAQIGPALPGSALAHLSRSPARTSQGFPISEDEIKQQPGDAPKYKSYKFLGLPLTAHPGSSDGSVLEDRLGDFEAVSGLTAIHNLLRDIAHSYKSGGSRGGSGNPFTDYQRRKFNQRFHYN
ncbi:MAG: hypothetical protein [Wigfec virus K19_159]|nr:MAG: hypothetical protein [Wigfec virus K19_159]